MLFENEIDETEARAARRLTDEDVRILLFLQELKEASHCENLRVITGGRWAGTIRYLATWGLLTGRIGDLFTYDDRWCYSSHEKALAALEAWDGTGEPIGWHRHPTSGRRRPDGDPAQEHVRF